MTLPPLDFAPLPRRTPRATSTPADAVPDMPADVEGAEPARSLRRVPVQERGRRRVEAILDAAASVIAEVGLEAASTNAIAERANTAKGSLYQFFPSKEAIIAALAARYRTEVTALHARAFSGDPVGLPMERIIDRIFDPLVAYHDANPAYRHVFKLAPARPGAALDSVVRREWDDLLHSVVDRVQALLGLTHPHLSAPAAHRHALILVTAGESLMSLHDDTPRANRAAMLADIKRLCVAYLAVL